MSRILIVEDDKDSRDALAAFLTRAQHDVRCAPNGREALEQIIQATPDLVVLDLCMPEMDGVGLLEIMRSYLRWEALPVVVWTGAGDGTMTHRAWELKVNSVIAKGQSTYNDVLNAIGNALPKHLH